MMKHSLLTIAVFLSLPALLAGADPNTVAVWSFEEGQGDQVLDASGNGHHGKIVDGAKWSPNGKFGGAMEFDGVGS